MRSYIVPHRKLLKIDLQTNQEGHRVTTIFYTDIPDICPSCNMGINPRIIHAYRENDHCHEAKVVFQCPKDTCHNIFIGTFKGFGELYHFKYAEPLGIKAPDFSDEIHSISESFVVIYNDAFQAEKRGFSQICGAVYRKALEFLIKEYVIHNSDDESIREKIKNMYLAKVIKDYIPNEKIKFVAENAVWLVNEDTDYYWVWKRKDVDVIKMLIELTVLWIEMELKTQALNKEMYSIDTVQTSDAP